MARTTFDRQRLALAIQAPGIDPRHWCSYGTVGTTDDEGEFDPTDPLSIYIGPEGVEVDVLLEPLNIPVTCVYTGQQQGTRASVISPIQPGDRVLVVMPDGDLSLPPVVVCVLPAAHDLMPNDGGSPVFQNDRFLLQSTGQNLDIRSPESDTSIEAQNVQVVTVDDILLGSRMASEPFVLGNRWKTSRDIVLDGMSVHIHGTPVGPTSPPDNASVYQTEKANTPNILSQRIFGEE